MDESITTTPTTSMGLETPETTPMTLTETTPTTTGLTIPKTTLKTTAPPPVTVNLTGTEWYAPLTTTFVPPSSCRNRYYTILRTSESVVRSGPLGPEFFDCQPSGYLATFSPGMCPDLMTPAGTSVLANVNVELCCQVGFTWDPRGCASVIPSITSVLIVSNISDYSQTDTYTSVSDVVAMHTPITVLWEPTDLSLFPADVASSRSALLWPENINTNATKSGKSTLEAGLSLPARIGIGVGAALGAILLFAAIAVWLWKLRRRQQQNPTEPDSNHAQELDITQWTWKRYLGLKWRAELPQTEQRCELPVTQLPRAEMAENHGIAELPGDDCHRQESIS